MPQIIFSDEERAGIDRLVAKHSPSNHPLIQPTLALLQPGVRNEFVTEYEVMLRAVTETAFAVLANLEGIIEAADDVTRHELFESLREMLLVVKNTSHQGRTTDEILATLDVQGDSQLSEACFRLSSKLIDAILAGSGPRVAVTS